MNGSNQFDIWDHVTLVVPTFNQSKLLSEFLNRFLLNAPIGLLLHVVDDGSTDETSEVLIKYGNHSFIRVSSISHLGAGAARNFGIHNCETEWIAFTDTDVILTDAFYSGLKILKNMSPEIVAVEGKIVAPSKIKPPLTHWLENHNGGTYATANFAVRTKSLLALNGFDTNFVSNLREDTDLGLRLVKFYGQILFDPDRIVLHPFVNRNWFPGLVGTWKKQGQIILTEILLYTKHPREYRMVRRFSNSTATLTWWSKWNLLFHMKIHWPWVVQQLRSNPIKMPSIFSRYFLSLILAGWEQIALFIQFHFRGFPIR